MDGSARDLQLRRNNGQWLLGKTLDTFCPLGSFFTVLFIYSWALL